MEMDILFGKEVWYICGSGNVLCDVATQGITVICADILQLRTPRKGV